MAADPLQLERDEVRFDRLYREYAADVYRYALAIMRNPSDAEDVVQTTFLNAWRAFSAGEEPRAPLNWFITIAHNVCRLRFRTNSRRPREVEFEPALAEAPVDDGPTAGDVLDALAELPLNQRAALVMRELEGRSYGEIATVLGVSRSAVETLIFRARRSLRIRRDSIRTLTLLPLPQSLTSFLRTPGAAEAGAGATAVLGSGLAAKAVALLAAGVVATGVARDTVRAEATPNARVASPTQVETVAPWTATPVALVVGGQAAPARSAPTAARSVSPGAVGPRQIPTRGGGRLAAIDEPEGAPGAAPGAPPGAAPGAPAVPTPSQPEQPAQPVGPEPGGEAPPGTHTPTLPTVPGTIPSPPPVPGLLPTLPELPALPAVPQLPQLPSPSVPPVSTPDLPVPEVPVPELPKLPEVPVVPLPPPPPVDLPDLPELPDLPKLP